MRFFMVLLAFAFSITRSSAQLFSAYKSGYYIDANQVVHRGVIKSDEVDNGIIKFKEADKQKPVKLSPEEIAGYVIEKDSFAVVKDFEIPYGFGYATIKAAFAKVLISGEVTLYENIVANGYGQTQAFVGSYLLKKKNSDQIIRVPNGPGKFKKLLSYYFRDSSKVSQEIEAGTLTYEHILQIVETYNQEMKNNATASKVSNGF